MKTIDLLLSRGSIDVLVDDDTFASQLLSLLKEEARDCSDIPRLQAILNVSAGLIHSVKQSPEVTMFVCTLLKHEYPRIRSLAAEKLYVRIQETDSDLDDDHRAMKLLLHHSWELECTVQERQDAACEIRKAFDLVELRS